MMKPLLVLFNPIRSILHLLCYVSLFSLLGLLLLRLLLLARILLTDNLLLLLFLMVIILQLILLLVLLLLVNLLLYRRRLLFCSSGRVVVGGPVDGDLLAGEVRFELRDDGDEGVELLDGEGYSLIIRHAPKLAILQKIKDKSPMRRSRR
jgi:hypothetical protein